MGTDGMSSLSAVPAVTQTYFVERCYNMTGLEVNGYDPCRAHTVNLPFEVDIAAFEVAILNAMDHVGYVTGSSAVLFIELESHSYAPLLTYLLTYLGCGFPFEASRLWLRHQIQQRLDGQLPVYR